MRVTRLDHMAMVPRPARSLAVIASLGIAVACGLVAALTGSPLPLAAAGVLGLLLLLLSRPEIGTMVFLGLLWINAPGVAAQFHNVPALAANAIALLLFIPVLTYLLRRQSIVVTPALFALLLFLAANLISAAASQSPLFGWVRIQSFLSEGLLIYLLVTNSVRTPRTLRSATWVLVLAAVAMGGLSIHQEFTESYLDPYLGFSQTTRQEASITEQPDADSRPKMMGPIGEQNRYAQILLIVLPLAMFGLAGKRGPWWRLATGGMALVIVAGVLLTFSRGAAVALVGLLAALVIWRFVRLSHMVLMVSSFLLVVVLIAPEFIARVDSIRAATTLVSGEGEGPDGAILGRTTSNLAALLVFADHPLIGVGPGVYSADYSVEYANKLGLRHFNTTRRAHNMYLEWAADLGIIGLGAGVGLIGVTMIQLARLRRFWRWRNPDYASMAGAYWLALMAYAGTAVFLHLSYERYFFTLMALANAAIWILSRERAAFEKDKTSPEGTQMLENGRT